MAQLTQNNITLSDFIPDAGVLMLGGAMASTAVQISAGKILRKILGPLLRENNGDSKIKQKAGGSLLWGYSAAAILFFAMILLASQNGSAPSWFHNLLGTITAHNAG